MELISSRKSSPDKIFLLIALIYIALNLPFLDSYPPIDYTGDESWYMNYSIELIKTGRIKGSMFPLAGELNHGNIFNAWLYNGMLSAFFMLMGKGILQGRLLSFLCGLFTIYIVYRIGKDFYDRKVGLLAAAFLSTSIFFSWSMRETRPEAMFTLVLSAGYYFLLKFIDSEKPLYIFMSSLLIASLIEIHPNAVVTYLSLIILFIVMYRKIITINTIPLISGFITVGALWLFINYLPYKDSALTSMQTVHRLYTPPILSGEWNKLWDISIGHLRGFKEMLMNPTTFMNNIPMAFPFLAGTTAFVLYLSVSRRNIRKILSFILIPLTLWFASNLITSEICQPSYLTYFMPFFALIVASSFFEIREYLKPRKILYYFVTAFIVIFIGVNITTSVKTNLKAKDYKNSYDYIMEHLKSTLPPDAIILGSTNYYQAFLGSDRYYTWTFMQERCPDFGITVKALDVDYIIYDDMLRNLSRRWCWDIYYEKQIVRFLKEQCSLVDSLKVEYPNFNGTDNFLRELHIFKVIRVR